MKRFLFFILAIALSIIAYSQSPEKISYQAVIRNSSGSLLINTPIGIKISILQGSSSGTVIYVEIQTPTTNANGLLTIEIGGAPGFNTINWEDGPYFVKTEIDPAGGTSYTISGASQLLSVPYAFYSKTAGTLTGAITENDPIFGVSPAKGITSNNIGNWTTAYGWGNHEGLYRTASWVPSWIDMTGKPAFASVATSGSFTDLINKPTSGNGINIDGTNKISLNIASQVAGDMMYFDGTNWIRIPKGATGQILTINSSGVPAWQNQLALPTATSASATSITSTGGNLNGIINANGLSTSVTFEYGTDISYGSVINATQNPVEGNTNTNVSASVTGLTLGATYHFRIKAVNILGTSYSSDMTFITVLSIGDNYQGGLVFFIDGTGQHGLICAAGDQGTSVEWGCSTTSISGTSTVIGTGLANTTAIISGCPTAGIAAKICLDLVLNTYSDWYLPSKDELNLMYLNLHTRGLGGFSNIQYWSSSEFNINCGWAYQFGGTWTNRNKGSGLYVRTVRTF
jgi:hypothetical protein